jgi:hypothetical protein
VNAWGATAQAELADNTTIQGVVESFLFDRVVRLEVLSETPGVNRVVRVTVNASSAGSVRSVIVKCFASEAFLLQNERLRSWSASLGPSAVTRFAEPLLVDNDANLVMTADLGSDRLDDLLVARLLSDREKLRLMVLVGTSLGEIQKLDPLGLPVASMSEHLAQLVHPHPSELIHAMPDRRALLTATVTLLTDLLQQVDFERDVAPVVSHRDFHLRQLLRVDSGVGVIDWDYVAAADPAFDVAYLLTYLETHRLDPFGERSAAFLAGYHAMVGPADPSFSRRVATYRLFNLLRRACRWFRLERTDIGDKNTGGESECRRMLDLLDASVSAIGLR